MPREPYDAAHTQWTWCIVPGGSVWHAYADDARVEMRDRFSRRQAICGVWRRAQSETFFGHNPPGRVCDDCRALWDEHYRNFEGSTS